MDPALEGIKPEAVARHFSTFCSIPRGSRNEAGVRDYLKKWAESRGLAYRVDTPGNIAIDVPASKDSHASPIVLQAHMDMVCVKVQGSAHDFTKDPIPLEKGGDWLHSKGCETTLGADNGMGLSIALAMAEDASTKRPPLTILATVEEEDGMKGALELGDGMIPQSAREMINLDVQEGAENLCVGCADAALFRCEWAMPFMGRDVINHVSTKTDMAHFTLRLTGLLGGHSGIDIDKGRGNALLMLMNGIQKLEQEFPGVVWTELRGGQAGNAIPPEASAGFYLPSGQENRLVAYIDALKQEWTTQLKNQEKKLFKIIFSKDSPSSSYEGLESSFVQKVAKAILTLPQGPLEKNTDGRVLVSNNVGRLDRDQNKLKLVCFLRSAPPAIEFQRQVEAYMKKILEESGARVDVHHDRGWMENEDSRLLRLATEVNEKQGRKTQTFVYHASVEVGVLKKRLAELGHDLKGWSSIAFGPVTVDCHSPQESVNVTTIAPAYELLKGILEKLA